MYYPDKPDAAACGTDWLWNRQASSMWHYLKIYVKMNDVGTHQSCVLAMAYAWQAQAAWPISQMAACASLAL